MLRQRFEGNLNTSEEVALAVEVWVSRTDHVIIPDPQWGRILKGTPIDIACAPLVNEARKSYNLGDLSSSVAIGVMEADSYHPPFVRNVEGVPNAVRVYKVLSGSFMCVRDGKPIIVDSMSEYICEGNQDIFSFKAREEGCVYAIIDFPAFDLGFDVNEIIP